MKAEQNNISSANLNNIQEILNYEKSEHKIVVSEEKENSAWDYFLSNAHNGHHEQTSLWGQVKEAYGWKPIRIIIYNNRDIVAGAQILYRKIKCLGSVGYLAKGPCIGSDNVELVNLIINAINDTALSKKMLYMVIDLPYYGKNFIPYLLSAGFKSSPKALPPTGLMTATLVINLENELEDILAQMQIRTRYNIRHGLRKGVTVREGKETDIGHFFELMVSTAIRRCENPIPADERFFSRLWQLFEPKGWLKLFITEYCNEVVAIYLAFPFGDTVRVWKVGWSGKHANVHPNNVCWWEIIVWAKKNGYHFLDFVQVDPYIADILKNKKLIPEYIKMERLFGSTKFKLGFGGQVLEMPGAYSYFYNPLIRIAFNSFGNKLLESNNIVNIAKRIVGLITGFN